MGTLLAVCGVVAGCCVITGLVVWAMYIVFIGPHYESVELIPVKCPHCTGGVQVMVDIDGENLWGPIPKHWRIDQGDGYGWGTFEPPVANKRDCRHCQGLGHTWISPDDIRLPPPHGKRHLF